MNEFSQELVSRLQAYFRKRLQKELSESEAQEYLRSYADAFLAFAPEKSQQAWISPFTTIGRWGRTVSRFP